MKTCYQADYFVMEYESHESQIANHRLEIHFQPGPNSEKEMVVQKGGVERCAGGGRGTVAQGNINSAPYC